MHEPYPQQNGLGFFENPLNFQSSIARSLALNPTPEARNIRHRLNKAWESYPDTNKKSLEGRLTDFNKFRGAAWELYFWEALTANNLRPEIEVSAGVPKKSVDFSWMENEKFIRLEVTSRSLSQENRKISELQDQLHLYLSENVDDISRLIIISIRECDKTEPDMNFFARAIMNQFEQVASMKSEVNVPVVHRKSGWEVEVRFGDLIYSKLSVAPIILEPIYPEVIDQKDYRDLLAEKFSKFDRTSNCLNIVGIVGAHMFPPSIFDVIGILYGQIGVQISEHMKTAKNVFIDESFFMPGNSAYSHIAGVLIGFGSIPGFTSMVTPIFCLNPNFGDEFNPSWLPIDSQIIRLKSNSLEELEKDGTWTQLDSWF